MMAKLGLDVKRYLQLLLEVEKSIYEQRCMCEQLEKTKSAVSIRRSKNNVHDMDDVEKWEYTHEYRAYFSARCGESAAMLDIDKTVEECRTQVLDKLPGDNLALIREKYDAMERKNEYPVFDFAETDSGTSDLQKVLKRRYVALFHAIFVLMFAAGVYLCCAAVRLWLGGILIVWSASCFALFEIVRKEIYAPYSQVSAVKPKKERITAKDVYIRRIQEYNDRRMHIQTEYAKAVGERIEQENAVLESVDRAVSTNIEELSKSIRMLCDVQNMLYEMDIIRREYHCMPAVAAFICYFESGRCQAFAGPGGAYDVYEAELHMSTTAVAQVHPVMRGYNAAMKEMDVRIETMKRQLEGLIDTIVRRSEGGMLPIVCEEIAAARALYAAAVDISNDNIAV